MTQRNNSTSVRTFKHLSETERGELYAYQSMGLSMREMARKMNRNVGTISRELKRGSVRQMNSQLEYTTKYFPDAGSRVYKANRLNCGAHSCDMKA